MSSILIATFFLVILLCYIYYIELVIHSNIEWQITKIPDEKLPKVSIIVPTLEEEKNIQACLKSLKRLDYPDYEIIVVDGGSRDDTVKIAKNFADITIVDSYLPKGWVGKSYGCHIGFQHANGDILLFTDADTVHHPLSLRAYVGHLLGTESGMLSLLPYQKAERWYEYLISFYFFFSFLASGPLTEVSNPYKKDAYMAIGQYLLFTREAYMKIGGHLTIQSSLVEDVALAKLCKENNIKIQFFNKSELVSCRMYPGGFKAFYHGFEKSIYGGLTALPLWRIFFIILWIIYGGMAPFFVISALLKNPISLLEVIASLTVYLSFAGTIFLYWRERGDVNIFIFLLYPIFLGIDIGIILVSIYKGITGEGVVWKSRTYNASLSGHIRRENK